MKKKIARVKWLDANSKYGWRDDDEEWELFTIDSVGYVVKETKDFIVLTTSVSQNDHYMDPITIPKKMIVSRR